MLATADTNKPGSRRIAADRREVPVRADGVGQPERILQARSRGGGSRRRERQARAMARADMIYEGSHGVQGFCGIGEVTANG